MPASVYIPPPLASEARLNIQDQTATSAVDSGAAQDDSSLCTVDGLVRRRARLHPNSHAISYPSSGISYVDYTMQQLDVFAWRVAKHYEAHLPPRTSSAEKPAVVAMLGPSNLEYLITKMALSKLGHTILLLSTRIPQAAIENLINVTDAKTLLIDAKFEQMGTAIQEGMQNVKQMSIAPRSVFEFPIDVVGDTQLDGHLDPEVEKDNIIFIIHSSGSTGLPKPICQTQKSCIANYSSSMNMKAFVTLPLYHNHGICNLYRAIYAIKPLHMYNADLPLTQGHLIETMRQNQFEVFYGVPYALKLLSETEQGIRILQDLKIVMYGGSALSDDLGNLLVEKGVNLIGHYGATEVGQLMTSFRPQGDKAWNYVREHEKLIPYLRWVPRGPNLYECTVAEGWPAKVQSNQPDGSYATKDLFEPHPSIPRAWKYIARLDDTLVLLNGEKFGPVGMEGTIRSNKNVTEACVFGAGRPYLGLLVVPASHLKDKTDEEVADAIWPAVEAANEKADAFARISKSMIRVLPADCPYPRTDKGSIIRQAFYKAFEKEIDETYDAQDLGSDDLQAMDVPELRVFLRKLLLDTLASNVTTATSTSGVSDETDFFALGMDSLQAIQMRSQILKNVDVGGHKLGQNVVFDHPSIEKLAAFLHALRTGLNEAKDTTIESEMQSLISKYSDVPVQPSSVALTGATGSLGAHVAAVLAVKPEIGSIYCLVRATDAASARRRVKDSMIQRKVYHSLPLEARRKIIALPSDLSDPRLGLADGTYETVLQSLRTVIHCAWSVNFNMRLSSFEQSNIAGVRNLLSLCRSSRNGATMNFCSSVSTCTRATVSPVPESLPELEWAQGMGYAQSKSVAEHICARAAEQGITARVLRVGQIVADSRHGVWNAQEAVPMMMQTAVTIGALPKLTETPSWLPVDITAEAISDISLSDAGSVFANVAHPKSFNFINDLLPALRKTGLDFEEVAPKEWIRRLRDSNVDPKVNPPIKLVDFFASKYDKEDSEFGPSKKFSTSVACSLSPALANAPGLSQTQVDRFISYFLKSSWRPKASEDTKTAIIMAGPCGTGKSTAGAAIAQWLGVPFIEGDNLHKQDAVAKMRSATPLSDEDRRSWLMRVSSHGREALTELGYPSVVISCSALKRSYRDTIRTSLADDSNIRTAFIDLQADKDLLSQRLQDRRGHYMTSAMVQGQLEIHEVAGAEEDDVLPVDAEGDVETVIAEAKYLLAGLGLKGLNADI